MDIQQRDVVFIDAYNLIYRAYHGNPAKLTNKEGLPTTAIYTTIKMLQNLPEKFNDIAYCVAVFDGGGNFRTEIDAEYKANRKPMPEDLVQQMPHIKEAFEILGWPTFQAQGVEADDVIGALAKRAANKGFNTYIVSGDKDFRVLVDDNLHILDTMQDICYDPHTVKEKMGIDSKNVTAYLALLGDGTDNIIGVDKIGTKTAAKLLNEYGDLDGIRANQDKVKGVAGENLRAAFANGQIDKNMQLATLKTDINVHITVKDVKMKPVNTQRWVEFCEKMNFQSFPKRAVKP